MLKNEPLTANARFKVIVFLLMLVSSIFIFVGIIPVLFLALGYFLMKKNKSFSSVEESIYLVSVYCKIGVALSALCCIVFIYKFPDEIFISILAGLISASIFYAFIVALRNLYFVPLSNHSEWVVENGLFSRIPKNSK